MPVYDLQCLNAHTKSAYVPHPDDRRARTHVCACGHTMSYILSRPGRFTYFSESSPRIIENMSHEPVVVRSHWEHEQLMKKHEVAWVPQKRGMPGCWG